MVDTTAMKIFGSALSVPAGSGYKFMPAPASVRASHPGVRLTMSPPSKPQQGTLNASSLLHKLLAQVPYGAVCASAYIHKPQKP